MSKISKNMLITIILFTIGILSLILYFVPIQVTPVEKPKLEYKILTVTHIISGAYKVYGNPKLGLWVSKVILTNKGGAPLYDLKVLYRVEGYSDWSEGNLYPILLPNSTVIDLYYPIFSSEIAKLTTSTPSNVKIKITFTIEQDGKPQELIETKPVTITGVHDFIFTSIPPEENTGTFYDIFDNYPLLGAWATPTDPVVMKFADMGNKLAGGAGASLSDEEALKSLEGMWTLSVYNGIQYKTEPEAFWTGKMSQYIKYPRDVIRDKAGTCIDTALFFASLAMSQGLRAYVTLMPGHAFPIIVLPKSGNLIPIESTALNTKSSFKEAIESGVKTFSEATKGPYIIVDIQSFQAMGITPPELEPLPVDVLEKWGIKSPTATQPQQPKMEIYSNPLPKWSISYPNDWTIQKPNPNEVDFYSPEGIEMVIVWGQGYDKEGMRSLVESYLSEKGSLEITQEKEIQVSGVPAILVVYTYNTMDKVYLIIARYLDYGGYGYSILYDFISTDKQEALINICESIVATFKLGG
jgi:hypothetical protein